MPRKRARTFHTGGAKRPIQKTWVSVVQATIGTTAQITNLGIVTVPVTIVSWRWHFNYRGDGGTSATERTLVIGCYLSREGTQLSPDIDLTDGATFAVPEENVIFARAITFNEADIEAGQAHTYEGFTKTMRKLKAGDRVNIFVVCSSATQTCQVNGEILLFAKH